MKWYVPDKVGEVRARKKQDVECLWYYTTTSIFKKTGQVAQLIDPSQIPENFSALSYNNNIMSIMAIAIIMHIGL